MQAFYTDIFSLPLPEGHRFPMAKYRLLREAALAAGVVEEGALRVPPAATDAQLALAHDPDFVRRATGGELTAREVRRLGFPWSEALVERSRRSVGGTLAACRAALSDGVAVNLAGGTHHAGGDWAEGYCLFNDAAVALRVLLAEGRIRHAVVIDTDVHQGNGTAAIFRADPAVLTVSIHAAKNFPFRKHAADIDVPLADGTGDEPYLRALGGALDAALARGPFDLAVVCAGADAWEGDRLGRLALSREGIGRRDAAVFAWCVAEGTPAAVTMAGGYAPEVRDIVRIHLGTIRAARQAWGEVAGSEALSKIRS